jgi:endonuclease YncB( thermonuclease family)
MSPRVLRLRLASTAGLLAASAVLVAASPGTEHELAGRVVSVADGDTLTLLVGEQSHRVRLAQIDAPESGQPGGRAAKRALSRLCFGKQVRVVVVDRDRYGRLVGEVFAAGLYVNREMVRTGNAWAYTDYAPSTEIVAVEDEARRAGRGLWALQEDQREPPWLWRRRDRRPAAATASGPRECGRLDRCTQMQSCEEARFYFEQCGVRRLDGDRDGIPCEKLCGNGG